jgi:hypothetical protein
MDNKIFWKNPWYIKENNHSGTKDNLDELSLSILEPLTLNDWISQGAHLPHNNKLELYDAVEYINNNFFNHYPSLIFRIEKVEDDWKVRFPIVSGDRLVNHEINFDDMLQSSMDNLRELKKCIDSAISLMHTSYNNSCLETALYKVKLSSFASLSVDIATLDQAIKAYVKLASTAADGIEWSPYEFITTVKSQLFIPNIYHDKESSFFPEKRFVWPNTKEKFTNEVDYIQSVASHSAEFYSSYSNCGKLPDNKDVYLGYRITNDFQMVLSLLDVACENNILIKRCQHCHSYFIAPTRGKSYCDRSSCKKDRINSAARGNTAHKLRMRVKKRLRDCPDDFDSEDYLLSYFRVSNEERPLVQDIIHAKNNASSFTLAIDALIQNQKEKLSKVEFEEWANCAGRKSR